MDRAYVEGGEASVPNMCHEPTGGPARDPAGKFGDGRCDSPRALVDSLLNRAAKEEIDWILWTGDDIPHLTDQDLNREWVLDTVTELTSDIATYWPNKPVVPVLGNHDMYPAHHLPGGPSWIYERLSSDVLWGQWLSDEALSTFRKGGFYVSQPVDGFSVIVLNT